MQTFLTIIAVLIGLGSWLFVSQATAGVAGIAFACLLAILARLAQADAHYVETQRRLHPPTTTPPQPPRPPIGQTEEEKAKAYGVSSR